MGSPLDEQLALEMQHRESAGLLRRLAEAPQAAGGARVDFSSNDYLGLARHPRVIEAARAALERHGAGGRASRLLGGGAPLCAEAERAVAGWLGAEAALLFPSGYQANLGCLCALAGRGDAIVSDRLNHASLIDAARLSRSRVFVHEHLDLTELERALVRARSARRRLVVTEGVFSMDGDSAALGEIDQLCARYDAWLVVDEAHAAGLVGPEGRGAWAALERPAATRLAARIVTGGKALGVAGAFVVGSRELREHLVNHARSLIFTTAPPPAVAGALVAAIEVARGAQAEREHALGLARELAAGLELPAPAGAIVPFPLGTAARALEVASRLRTGGFDVAAVRPPSVPEGGARLRLVCHAFNQASEIDELARSLASERPRLRISARSTSRALFVVGTDTGVGKTVVSALLLRAARARGHAAYWKPVQTGEESDRETVHALAGAAAHECLPDAWRFPLPASPHEAAAHAGQAIEPARIEEGLRGLLRTLPSTLVVVELAGGLLVPYRTEPELVTQADWLERGGFPLVLVARAGLGTLNHTLLTLEALRARHLEPRALFLVGAPHRSNRATLERVALVPRVYELPPLEPLSTGALDAWLEQNDLEELLTR